MMNSLIYDLSQLLIITLMVTFSLREKCADVGYGRLDFPTLKLSVVGGRPFSCGGKHIFRSKLVAARLVVALQHFIGLCFSLGILE